MRIYIYITIIHELIQRKMIATKRHTQHDQSPPKQLFADYPYPIINELSKTNKQEEPSDHTHTLISVEWYRECFYKMSGMLHGLHRRNSPTSIIEQSFRQAHIDGSSSMLLLLIIYKKKRNQLVSNEYLLAQRHHS